MRLQQFQNSYLYEGLDRSSTNTMVLWESAGFKLKEAALTADQIQQIFQNVEQGATDSGSNRTMLGKGKDAADAVNKAWEDLKTKIQDSGPIKNVDNAYDSAMAKIEKGLGGPDNAVNQIIQKYRKFAKEHPIAQGLIYSALIAAAGISGAGLGGAAVLGLLKMTDKLLQGEKFSSSAYSGAKTGAMAYGASKLGDLVKGKPEVQANPSSLAQDMKDNPMLAQRAGVPGIPNADAAENAKATAKAAAEFAAADPAEKAEIIKTTGMSAKELTKAAADTAADVATSQPYGAGMSSDYLQQVVDAGGKSGVRFKISPEDAQKALDWQALNTSTATDAATSAGKTIGGYSADYLQQVIDGTHPRPMINKDRAAELLKAMKGESINRNSKKLSEGQVYMVFNRVCTLNDKMLSEGRLIEGPLDAIKGAAGKAMNWAATKGKNLTTKVTADKLNSAWQKAGSPMDSGAVAQLLAQSGVDDKVIQSVYKGLKLPTPGEAGKTEPTATSKTSKATSTSTPATSAYKETAALIQKLTKKDKQRLLMYIQKLA